MDPILRDWIRDHVADTLTDYADLYPYAAQRLADVTMAALELHLLHDNVEKAVELEKRMWHQYEKAGGERPADAPQEE